MVQPWARSVSTITRDFSGNASATAAIMIPWNPSRKHVAIVNISTARIYIALGRPPATGEGIALNASGGSYEMDEGINMVHDDIWVIGSAAAEAFTAQEISSQ